MKKLFVTMVALGLFLALAAGGYLLYNHQRIQEFAETPYGDETAKTVEIPSGTGPLALSNRLEEAGVVSDADSFYGYIRGRGLIPALKAGEYEFSGEVTPEKVARDIVEGNVKQYRFTVPEGYRIDETVPLIVASGLPVKAERLSELANDPELARSLGVPAPAQNLEGFLFPDTYTFPRSSDERAVLAKMVSRTLEEYEEAQSVREEGNDLSMLEIITLGSIIEKETGAVEERPRIGCVFHNRLKRNMRLDTDPTVLYAMMLIRGEFTKNISRRDLRTRHPYNTYTVKGLPPGPIASPGAAAIRAALDPAECDDLFFVSKNDGTHVFCPTLQCHERAVDKWQRVYFGKKPLNRGR